MYLLCAYCIIYVYIMFVLCMYVRIAAMAVALGNLYRDEVEVADENLVGVLAAACILKYKALIDGYDSKHLRTFFSHFYSFPIFLRICSYSLPCTQKFPIFH